MQAQRQLQGASQLQQHGERRQACSVIDAVRRRRAAAVAAPAAFHCGGAAHRAHARISATWVASSTPVLHPATHSWGLHKRVPCGTVALDPTTAVHPMQSTPTLKPGARNSEPQAEAKEAPLALLGCVGVDFQRWWMQCSRVVALSVRERALQGGKGNASTHPSHEPSFAESSGRRRRRRHAWPSRKRAQRAPARQPYCVRDVAPPI